MGSRAGAVESMAVDPDFWRARRVLLTGHTGFKGAWLALWLQELGAEITGLSLDPHSQPSLFEGARVGAGMKDERGDIRDEKLVDRIVARARPEIVFHLAAQALVRESYRDPVGTFASNIMGTVNVLEALRRSDATRVAIVVTSDKCYVNDGSGRPYCEHDPLGGRDPYSSSKAAAELVSAAYRDSFLASRDVRVATVRAGNVIGGGDWSEDRLVPDAMRAWSRGEILRLRNPDATRPWQHVLTPLMGCLILAQRAWYDASLARAWNFGPTDGSILPVREVIAQAARSWGADARWEANVGEHPHEAALLALDSTRAVNGLGYSSRWPAERGIAESVGWYRRYFAGEDMCSLTLAQIHSYAREN